MTFGKLIAEEVSIMSRQVPLSFNQSVNFYSASA